MFCSCAFCLSRMRPTCAGLLFCLLNVVGRRHLILFEAAVLALMRQRAMQGHQCVVQLKVCGALRGDGLLACRAASALLEQLQTDSPGETKPLLERPPHTCPLAVNTERVGVPGILQLMRKRCLTHGRRVLAIPVTTTVAALSVRPSYHIAPQQHL